MSEKLHLKGCLQWLCLHLLKQQPLSAEECYEQLHKVLPPPPQPGSPSRRYSKDKVRSYLKDLETDGYIVSVSGESISYSITKRGHEQEPTLRQLILNRVETVHKSLYILLERVNGNMHSPPVLVPREDREFVRSLLTVKDVIRFYLLESLKQKPNQSLTDLQKQMVSQYGWTCSPSYFLLIGRNEMSEGVDASDEPLDSPVILLKSKYQGKVNRRKIRTYSLTDSLLAEEWKGLYARAAAESIGDAITFTSNLLSTLKGGKL